MDNNFFDGGRGGEREWVIFWGMKLLFFSPCMIFLAEISLCKNFFIINFKIMIVESTYSFFSLASLAHFLLCGNSHFGNCQPPNPTPPPTSSKTNGASLKAGVKLHRSEIWSIIKRELLRLKWWEHYQTVDHPKWEPQVGRGLFGIRLLILH